MDKDQVKGKIKDVAGRVERQAGEWTGNEETQAEGAAKQVEGKVQNAWGNVKEAGRDAVKDLKKKSEETRDEEEIRREQERQKKDVA
jgi:uncharacterized protein YjbJ (UPF0337 family)